MMALGNVLPRKAQGYISCVLLGDPKALRHPRKIAAFRGFQHLPNLAYRIFGKLSLVVRRATPNGGQNSGPFRVSPLRVSVVVILGNRSGKQMGRVTACGIVARVTNKISLWYFSDGKSIGDSVGKFFLAISPKHTVLPVLCAAPRPTGARPAAPVNQRPEPIGNGPKLPVHRVPKDEPDRLSGNVPNCAIGSAGDLGFTATSTMAKPISMRPFEIVHEFMVCANSPNVNSGEVAQVC